VAIPRRMKTLGVKSGLISSSKGGGREACPRNNASIFHKVEKRPISIQKIKETQEILRENCILPSDMRKERNGPSRLCRTKKGGGGDSPNRKMSANE